jgi:hypothetical protein
LTCVAEPPHFDTAPALSPGEKDKVAPATTPPTILWPITVQNETKIMHFDAALTSAHGLRCGSGSATRCLANRCLQNKASFNIVLYSCQEIMIRKAPNLHENPSAVSRENWLSPVMSLLTG